MSDSISYPDWNPSRASTGETLLPGFGRPVNYIPQKHDLHYVGNLFPTALSSRGNVALPMTTLRELTMLQLMNSITDKPEWNVKVNDPEIAQKWKEEALASGRDITQKMVDWCIEELRYKASLIPAPSTNPPPVFVYNSDVVKSDVAVSPELKQELQETVKKFEENIPERLKDWHPNSDEKVWDLVHPSLFPLIYGVTRVLANGETTTLDDCVHRCGEGEIAPVPSEEETLEFGNTAGSSTGFYSWETNHLKKPFSSKFQWLPCEVDISGSEAKITSYINNLHPHQEKPLYELLAKLISASIPLWDLTLAPLREPGYFHERKPRIPYDRVEYDPNPEIGPEGEGPQQEPGEDDDDYRNRREEWYEATRCVVLPEPSKSFRPLDGSPGFSLKKAYKKRGLQVIVKLANIELTPDKPDYNGGSWHVEGQMNEHIVATSLYYYSCKNITTSTLSFRQQVETDVDEVSYGQYHYDWLAEVFGCEQDGPGVQEIGGVETREGRLLTFPNILQHRVGPFKLEDPTKPGHRKIVALFLVDPNIKVISTAHVPCQQQDWWWEVTRSLQLQETRGNASSSSVAAILEKAGVASLPLELQEHILEGVDFPISLQEAKSLRLELMEERKQFVVKQNAAFENSVFSLCEH